MKKRQAKKIVHQFARGRRLQTWKYSTLQKAFRTAVCWGVMWE